jgi:O-acetyl-ADP-ribose deacetylase
MKNSKTRIDIVRGDITKLHIDAIVNAANTTLLGGGGVDGAIHRAAGPELLAECRALGGCRPGEAKLTRGYKLPTRYVIHTVGPVWTGGKAGERQTLTNCYRNSLQLAVENGIKTIAFPAISCGAYRYPVPQAAQIAVETTRDFLATTDKIDKVIFVVTNDEIGTAYQEIL